MSAKRCTTRVLIVDDAEIMHEIFCDILASSQTLHLDSDQTKFVLSHARDKIDAAQLTAAAIEASDGFAVAFIDLRLGGSICGLELTKMIWDIDPFVQIVICTAQDGVDWRALTKDFPHRDRLIYLRKPFHPDEIRQLAEALSNRWSDSQAIAEQLWRLQREVDQRLEAETNLRRLAEHDALTKLPNRSVLLDRLQAIIGERKRGRDSIDATLFMDLDNFKTINDSLGHHAGDELLNQVANRLRTCVRTGASNRRGSGETVRLGGDEFVILLERLNDRNDAITVAKRVVDRIADPFTIGDRTVNVGSSVGIAFVDSQIHDPDQVLKNADTAMYRAKLAGKGRVAVFDSGMHQDINAKLELEGALRASLENDELKVLYQPIVDLFSGQIRSVEALLRWNLTDGRVIPPSRFIPLAEELGLITEIGYWTIEHAIEQMQVLELAATGETQLPINLSVNVSHIQLNEPDFESRVCEIVDRKRFPRNRLKLEVNESIAMRRPVETACRLKQLHDAGFGILMDDFGTGHSALSCFHQFHIETVKIDRTFVGSIAHNESHQAIVEAVIQLAHSLKATVIAEGLETADQIRRLRALGCDMGQGYYFASPINQQQLLNLMVEVEPEKRLQEFLQEPQIEVKDLNLAIGGSI